MKTVTVSASRRYDILIERGLLRRAGELVRGVTNAGTVMLVSDDSVWPLYGEAVQKSLVDAGFSVCRFVFPHGESSKCAKTYLALLDALCENQLTRADAVVALGGGVVGDLTGFAASTYLRGIGFIQIPTTLLAAVDSSVGGKTAIDLPAGKNLAGTFYQPCLVLCDPDCLDSLPDEIFRDGCAEVIKYAVLGNAPFFDELKNTPPRTHLEHIIETLREECTVRDNLQEEMLRILLKRFIIVCTRMARLRLEVDQERENGFDIIRQFYVLVDNHFKEKKQVQDYAEMLYRSPKTLSNLFSLYGLNSPLRIIHERVDAEARRLLLYTSKSAKEISEILGFEDLATFSRFFKKMNQKSISDFRREEKKEV